MCPRRAARHEGRRRRLASPPSRMSRASRATRWALTARRRQGDGWGGSARPGGRGSCGRTAPLSQERSHSGPGPEARAVLAPAPSLRSRLLQPCWRRPSAALHTGPSWPPYRGGNPREGAPQCDPGTVGGLPQGPRSSRSRSHSRAARSFGCRRSREGSPPAPPRPRHRQEGLPARGGTPPEGPTRGGNLPAPPGGSRAPLRRRWPPPHRS